MGIKETLSRGNESAREVAKKITDEVIPNTHIGNHTFETLDQEVLSLRNTKPMFRDSKYKKRFLNVEKNIMDKISHGQNQFQALIIELRQVEEMR